MDRRIREEESGEGVTPDWRPVVRRGFTLSCWNRAHNWVVVRTYNDRARLVIRFRSAVPTGRELIALRRSSPQFRDLPPAKLRSSIGNSEALSLSEMEGREARRQCHDLRAAGLEVDHENASCVVHHFHDRTTGVVWVNEDPAEAVAIAETMLAAGVPLQIVEA